jgi:phospholipid/cholesterol/gamma-HCH transport system substrate-binding protein
MESRAGYLLIGGFVLLTIAGLFGFVVWLTKVEINREFSYYDIYFEGSVAGLGKGGDVRYRGIRVGSVTAIGIDKEDPGRVHVTIQLGTDIPIREGDEASLELQGVTGVSFVNIEGAGPQSPMLRPVDGQLRAEIPSKKSAFQKLFSGAPDVIAHASEIMEKFSDLLNEDNQRAIGGILADVNQLTSTFASRQQQFAQVIDAVDTFAGELSTITDSVHSITANLEDLTGAANLTLGKIDSMVEGVDQVVRQDVTKLVAELHVTTQKLQLLVVNADAVVQENREPLNSFTGAGFKQFSNFLSDASFLVTSMTRLTERLETEGARFLLNNQQSEFQVDKK